ncbi:carbohydrate-binding module family 32 protein [Trichoderma citrinoviride]|uniref:alpha,alpha-trehalase n=1 Tax=Trichoderma citrinoviride TaxID=58853 RepID=A0A2T4BA71_9HYPO|nr:carbohydrate-binding module family 32 protein [Trichoderma citrinoviride]PTB66225.1 carbohydrate-binding module family 32 protein [Trichoderma citrinoviride]
MRSTVSSAAALLSLLQLVSPVHGTTLIDRITNCLDRHDGSNGESHFSKNVYKTGFDGVTWDEDNWLLSTTQLKQGAFEARGSVANGYLGINVASAGPFFELDTEEDGDVISGWPLFSRRQSFATIAGFWDAQPEMNGTNFPWISQYGSDTAISGIPHWSGLILDLGGDTYLDATVSNKTISNFRSTYDYKAGVLSWSYKWTPKGNRGSFDISYRLFANKLHVNQAVVDMQVTASKNVQASIVNVLDGFAAVRTDFVESGEDGSAIFAAVRPNGVANVTAYVYADITGSGGVNLSSRKIVHNKPYVHANASSIAQAVPVKFSAGRTVRVTKFVGAASSDAFQNPKQVAKKAAAAGLSNGYAKSLKAHVEEWATVMPESSVDSFADPHTGKLPADSYIIDSAIIAVTNAYYLLQNTVGKNGIKAVDGAPVNVDSISVGGLTSDSYAGQIFWDADLWMQPGLVAAHPEAAERITNYRLARYGQAKENVKTAYAGSKNETFFSASAAVFPWTSGRYGNCTATGPCWDYEYHLNGDIGISFVNQWVTNGDTEDFEKNLFPVYDSIAQLYGNLLQPNKTSWTLTNMTDPDEYANHVDAGGYTMPLIAETLQKANSFRKQFGIEQNKTWDDMASNALVLRENGVTLEFTAMNGTAVVKQADVIMLTYPLSYGTNYSALDALNDLDYYANKQSPDGPAMTYAFFSIVANEISPSGCSAYTYAQNAFKPYARAPFYQISEQLIDDASVNGGTHPAYPFLTGHGGAHQVVLFGYLGLRLVPDDVIHIEPNLPPQIPYLRYRTFYWRGWPISAWSNYTHTTLSRAVGVAALDGADKRFANKSITIHAGPEQDPTAYTLPVKGSVVVPNKQIGSQQTYAGNLVQCHAASSPDDYVPGQFPIAAVDGATSTKWQPASADKVSSITVSLDKEDVGSLVSGFHFDWAQSPPVNATVIFHNEALSDPATVLGSHGHSSSKYTTVTSLTNIELSDPYVSTKDLNAIAIPIGNTTNVTLSHPVAASRYASLLIVGNQGLDPVDVKAKNGTGATVAEWAIFGHGKEHSGKPGAHSRRRLNVRTAATLADPRSFMRRRL